MKIQVTADHIAEGITRDSNHCMFADAIREKVPTAKFIMVDLQTIRFTDGDTRYTYLTPAVAQTALLKFDQGDRSIRPFTLTLQGAKTRKSGNPFSSLEAIRRSR